MIGKTLDQITIEDIKQLIEGGVLEKKTLEYKAKLPENTYEAKKEFLADVSSFANTQGGDLIFGVKEENDDLSSELGFIVTDIDAEIARLENLLRDGLSPRLTVEIQVLKDNDKKVLIIRTKPSLQSPHRVVINSHDKFYKRNSNGKYPIDVTELRDAFLQSSSLIDKIKNFRTERIFEIKSGNTPQPLFSNKAILAMHLIPLSAFSTTSKLNAEQLLALKEGRYAGIFQPFNSHGWNHRINLDGVVAYTNLKDQQKVTTYTQLYRNGVIESVDASFLPTFDDGEGGRLPMGALENMSMKYCNQMLKLLKEFDFQTPFYIFLSLIGIKGFTVQKPNNYIHSDVEPIEVNELLLPEVIIESFDEETSKKFRPIFDMVWNASGISRSLNFDAQDNFILR